MFYNDVLVFPIYACRNWTRIKRYIFNLVPRGRKKIWLCKVGRDEKSLKSTDIKNWAAIAGGENEESEDEFLGKSDSDDEYVYCKSSYNNPQSEKSTVEPHHLYASLFVQLAICPTCSHNF